MVIDLQQKRRERLEKRAGIYVTAPEPDFSPVEWYMINKLKRAYIAAYGGTISVTDCDIFYTIIESTLDPDGVPTNADGTQVPDEDMEPIWLAALADIIKSRNDPLVEESSHGQPYRT